MKKNISLAFSFILSFSILSQAATYSGGSGTETDPYLIATPADMNSIGANPADWDKSFKLIADINMAAYTGTKYKIIGNGSQSFEGNFDGGGHIVRNLAYKSTESKTCIGLFGNVWKATIQNLGVENIDIDANGTCVGGLIGSMRESAVINCYSTGNIKSSSLSDLYIGGLIGEQEGTVSESYSTANITSLSSSSILAGGLVGFQSGTIDNCHSTGNLTITTADIEWSFVGGLVGSQNSSITNCYSSGNVTASCFAGGLVGEQYDTLADSYSTGEVNSQICAGGLVAINYNIIVNCYSTGEVRTISTFPDGIVAGGLIGVSSGSIANCYSMGAVTSSSPTGSCAGGLCGLNAGIIASCYSAGSVSSTTTEPDSASSCAGGVTGIQYGWLYNCFSTSPVSSTSISTSDYAYAGGLIGRQFEDDYLETVNCYSTGHISASGINVYKGGLIGCYDGISMITSCFWNKETSDQDIGTGNVSSTEVHGKTTSEMKNLLTFTNADWDFSNIDGDRADWQITANNYPSLIFGPVVFRYSGGLGTKNDPFLIANQSDLNFAGDDFDNHFKLIADLDMTFSPSIEDFSGVFDGNGHTIRNLNFEQNSDDIALFCYADSAVIKNLRLENVNIIGNAKYVGCLISRQFGGEVRNCSVEGKIKIADAPECYAGLLVGYQSDCVVTDCCAAGTLDISTSSECHAGGLIGYQLFDSTVENCSSNCSVIAKSSSSYVDAGGLIGSQTGLVTNCSSAGSILANALSDLSYHSSKAGGLVGSSRGTINNSHTTSSVTSIALSCEASAGGLAGRQYYGGKITNCFNKGAVKSESTKNARSGGLIGTQTSGNADCCYNTGDVNVSECTLSYSGGLIGYQDTGKCTYSYNTGAVNSCGSSGGVIGAQYKNSISRDCKNAGKITSAFSIKSNFSFVGGVIAVQSDSMAENCYNSGIVASILTFSNKPIQCSIGGLIGRQYTGEVINCNNIADIVVSNAYTSIEAGGLVGYQDNSIVQKSFSTGNLTLSSNNLSSDFSSAGGLIGEQRDNSLVANCYSKGNITLSFTYYSRIGGLIGSQYGNDCSVLNCYSTGTIYADDYSNFKGGLLGYQSESGIFENNFWDTQASGINDGVGNLNPDPTGITNKTTAQMKSRSTFTNAGWDFTGESVNGPNDVWRMCADGIAYPRFAYEYFKDGDFDCPEGADLGDFEIFVNQWLYKNLNYELYQKDGKHIVNFMDWNVIANTWDGDIYKLEDFWEQWLEYNAYCADIAPSPIGDGHVNLLDFAVFAENWMK